MILFKEAYVRKVCSNQTLLVKKTYKHVFCNSITVNKITIEMISLQHITNIVEKHKNMFFQTNFTCEKT